MSHSEIGHGDMGHAGQKTPKQIAALSLGAVGVVYGDIGTSPLYAMRESLHAVKEAGGIAEVQILGVLSLLLWSLISVVTLKYILVVLKADNNGEGGILSLVTLLRPVAGKFSRFVLFGGILGASLFFGDAMLTPAISVLSAVEGLTLVTPTVSPYILPLALVILVGLFAIQKRGTGKVAALFGPVTLVWFVTMAVCAIPHIIANPSVLWAFNPYYAAEFLVENIDVALVVMGAVFLAVTGAEGLYADMGHFGRLPIRIAWTSVVLPALTINYLGQAAFIMDNPEGLENPFFLMAPQWGVLPLVILATMATIVASQAVITGAFSLTQQAIQLGLLPRFEIRHTSDTQSGQIYLPRVNTILAVGVVMLVIEFKTSSELASAYGIAVSCVMFTTSLLIALAIRKLWHKSIALAILAAVPMLALEGTFVVANFLKVFDGGYVPLMIASVVAFLMLAWRRGTLRMLSKEERMNIPLEDILIGLKSKNIPVVPGTAIFLTQNTAITPTAMLHNLKHNKMLHEQNIILSVITEARPRVDALERTEIGVISDQFIVVKLHFGYMETPNISKALQLCRKIGVKFDIMTTSFFVSRRVVRSSAKGWLPRVLDKVYITLSQNATRPADFFHIPTDRVVELGTQVTL